MEEIYELTKNKRIFVRKKISNFLEKALRYCGYDFNHDVFKKIIYSEDEYKTPVEEKIKNTYDAYIYLLSNDKNMISKRNHLPIVVLLNSLYSLFLSFLIAPVKYSL